MSGHQPQARSCVNELFRQLSHCPMFYAIQSEISRVAWLAAGRSVGRPAGDTVGSGLQASLVLRRLWLR